MPGPVLAIVAFMDLTTRSEALRSMASSSGRFLARSRSSTNSASFTSLSASPLRKRRRRVGRQERHLDADPLGLDAGLAHIVDRLLHGIDRARAVRVALGRPERGDLLLVGLQAVAEECRFLRRTLGVDQQRQVAADAHGVHVVEEDGAMAAQQILDVVLGVGDQDIDAGLVHEPVELFGVEGDG